MSQHYKTALEFQHSPFLFLSNYMFLPLSKLNHIRRKSESELFINLTLSKTMAVACRIFHKERKLRKLINQKSIYFLSMYQQTVKTFVKHFSLLHFYKHGPDFKTALDFSSISTAWLYMRDLFGLLFSCKIFVVALSIVWMSYLVWTRNACWNCQLLHKIFH